MVVVLSMVDPEEDVAALLQLVISHMVVMVVLMEVMVIQEVGQIDQTDILAVQDKEVLLGHMENLVEHYMLVEEGEDLILHSHKMEKVDGGEMEEKGREVLVVGVLLKIPELLIRAVEAVVPL